MSMAHRTREAVDLALADLHRARTLLDEALRSADAMLHQVHRTEAERTLDVVRRRVARLRMDADQLAAVETAIGEVRARLRAIRRRTSILKAGQKKGPDG
jgi:hypothetical protein